MVSRVPSVFSLHILLQKYNPVGDRNAATAAHTWLPGATNRRRQRLVLRPQSDWRTLDFANAPRAPRAADAMGEVVCGTVPRKEELLMALQKRDMCIYLGQVFFKLIFIGDMRDKQKF